jgi:xylulokinase
VDHSVRACIQQLGKKKDRVRAIGVSGQQHGFVPLNKKNEVIRPAKLWCDTSTMSSAMKSKRSSAGRMS